MDEQLQIAQQLIGAQQIRISQLEAALQEVGGMYRDLKSKYEPDMPQGAAEAAADAALAGEPIQLNRATRRRAAKAKS